MLGLTPDPLNAGVGRRLAVAGPYGHERVTAWQDGADAQRKNTAGGSVSSGRARAPDVAANAPHPDFFHRPAREGSARSPEGRPAHRTRRPCEAG